MPTQPEQKKSRNKASERASTYPPVYLQIFMRVAQTGEELLINNLENKQSAYVSLRARLNAFRLAYSAEAAEEGNEHMQSIAQELYAVTLSNPEIIDGKWTLPLRPKGYKFVDVLEEALAQHEDKLQASGYEPPEPVSTNTGRTLVGSSAGSSTIADLYRTEPEPPTEEEKP